MKKYHFKQEILESYWFNFVALVIIFIGFIASVCFAYVIFK